MKAESEKIGLKLNIQPTTSCQAEGEMWKQ